MEVELADLLMDGLQAFLSSGFGGAGGSKDAEASPSPGAAPEGISAHGDTWAVKLVDALGHGLDSAMGALVTVGSHLADKLMEGVVSSFGKSGEGLKQVVSGVFDGVTGIAGQIFGNVGGMLRNALNFAAKAPEMIGSTVGGIIGGGIGLVVGEVPGMILGAQLGSAIGGAIFGVLGKVMSGVVGIFSSIIDQLGQMFKVLGEAAGKIISGVISVLQDAVMSTIKMAQNILSLRNNTGMTTGQATNTYLGLRAQGISAGTITSMFSDPNQSPELFRMKARAWGLKGDYRDKDFMPNLADRVQEFNGQGVEGQFRKKAMLQSLGVDNPEMVQFLNKPKKEIQEQQAWQGKVDSALGIAPSAMEKIAEKVSMLIQRFEYFADVAKARLAQEFLPALQGGLEAATNFMAANAGKIAAGIRAAMEWTYAVLPKLILNGASYALGFIASLMGGIGKMLSDFSNGKGILHSILQPIANMWDMMMRGIRAFYTLGVVIWEELKRALVQSMPKKFGIQNAVQNLVHAKDTTGIQKAQDEAWNKFDVTGGNRTLKALEKSDPVKAAGDFTTGVGDKAQEGSDWFARKSLDAGTVDERRADFEKMMLDQQKEIAKNTQQTASHLKKALDHGDHSAGQAKSYVEALIVHGMRRARTR